MDYWLVVPAAGSGQRFGGDLPKQYTPLAGRTVIEWALAPFLADARCRRIVVALGTDDHHFAQLAAAGDPRILTVPGGPQRCDSVRQALSALNAEDDDWVLVHDAARPCVSRGEIDALLAAVASDDVGGLLALPVADTLKRADGEQRVCDTPSRESLWRALTPQMFRAGLLRRALHAAHAGACLPTDEAQAVEWLGFAPRLVRGDSQNVKVTEQADLALAAVTLAQRSALS
jgi:2-C-methyl-D-erythritol 4-phosphate cytidylyltransferase